MQLEPDTLQELRAWASEETRPLGNLLYLIITRSLAERRHRQVKPAPEVAA
jgi:hypothetical protein